MLYISSCNFLWRKHETSYLSLFLHISRVNRLAFSMTEAKATVFIYPQVISLTVVQIFIWDLTRGCDLSCEFPPSNTFQQQQENVGEKLRETGEISMWEYNGGKGTNKWSYRQGFWLLIYFKYISILSTMRK